MNLERLIVMPWTYYSGFVVISLAIDRGMPLSMVTARREGYMNLWSSTAGGRGARSAMDKAASTPNEYLMHHYVNEQQYPMLAQAVAPFFWVPCSGCLRAYSRRALGSP